VNNANVNNIMRWERKGIREGNKGVIKGRYKGNKGGF